jgi:tetratricopeptide (TPR) repeat protein
MLISTEMKLTRKVLPSWGKSIRITFNRVIPVYAEGSREDAISQFSLFDRAIEKASIVIQRHSIYIKKVEYVRWIDDSYLLLGKSYYYKRDYDLAFQTFSFVMDRFKNNEIYYDAVIWKARTCNRLEKFREAEALLLSIDKKIQRNQAGIRAEKMYPLVYADYYIEQEQYAPAIEYLKDGIKRNRNKKTRIRLNYLLAQVYQRTGNIQKASEHYLKVINYNPPYDIAFSSKINLARCYDVTMGDSRDIKKQLNRMLRDDKNKDYRDQIYFALAEVYMKENNESKAIENLKLSARSSVSDNYQKGLSYLTLANIYYDHPEYKPAQMFYDSAVSLLPEDYPLFDMYESRSKTLTELVTNLNIIELEDSLQLLAALPVAERNARIDKIIEELVREEERKRREEADRQISLNNLEQMNNQNALPGSQWYFYNATVMNFGFNEFVKKWGNRKLEDLWRLSNKQVVSFEFTDNQEEQDTVVSDSVAVAQNPKDRNTYIRQLPLTPEALAKSNEKIMQALYNAGFIFKEGLNDFDKSVETFNTLLKRYPDNPYLLSVYYNLYEIFREKEDFNKSDYYKNLILKNYPESDYAKILTDPEYYKKIDEARNIVAVFYRETYVAFEAGDYERVKLNADSAIRKYVNKDLIPKFAYLRALAVGKTSDTASFIAALKKVADTYPEHQVKQMSLDLINLLTAKPAEVAKTSDIPADTAGKSPVTDPASIYKFDPSAFHFYIMVLDAKQVKSISEVKIAFSNLNTQLFSGDRLTVSSMFLDDKRQIINVGRFDNRQKGNDYVMAISNSREIMDMAENASYTHFIISANNYATFFKQKNVEQYMLFYKQNYQIR